MIRRLFSAALGISIAAVPCVAQSAERAVFTRAEIQAAGWQRISEIFDAAPGWRVTTTDGFTITPTADGLPAPGASGPGSSFVTVIVDGARVPVSLLGQQEMEFVPVVLAQLDSVVLTTAPRVVGSRIETRGTIEFFTRRPAPGLTGQGEFQVGDVARKPALYKYTPLNPYNREHHGPFHHLLFGWGGSRGGVDVGYRFATLNTTDSLIAYRTPRGLNAGTAQINVAAPVVHADLDAFGGRHSFDATRTHYSGLFFVPALGHEQAFRMYATSLTAAGDAALPAATGLTYSAAYTGNDLTPLPSPSPSTLVHRRRNVAASADLTHAIGAARGTFGVAVDRWQLENSAVSPTTVTTDDRFSAQLDAPPMGGWTNRAAVTLVHSDGATNAGGLLTSRLAPSDRDVLTLTLASTSQAATENGAWIDPLLLTGHVAAVTRRTNLADASWTHSVSDNLSFLHGARLSSASGWPIALPSDTGYFELIGGAPPDPVSATVRIASARIGAESHGASRWYGRLLYSFSTDVGGDAIARTAARSVARHQLNGIAWFVPAPDWRFMSVMQAVSPTHWSAFPSIYGGWPPDVGAFTRIDLGAEKWLWSRHFRLQYQVRDILNQSERWQPRSAQFNLRWMLSASFVAGMHD